MRWGLALVFVFALIALTVIGCKREEQTQAKVAPAQGTKVNEMPQTWAVRQAISSGESADLRPKADLSTDPMSCIPFHPNDVLISGGQLSSAVSVDHEAVREAWKLFTAHFSVDGDNYYGKVPALPGRIPFPRPEGFAQLRSIRGTGFSNTPSEADTLNGVQWDGTVIFEFGALRMYSNNSKTWSDWSRPNNGFQVTLKKVNGNWRTEIFNSPSTDLEPIDAVKPAVLSEVPASSVNSTQASK